MPFNEIKIDRSLGMEMHRSTEARTITRSIVDLAHNLGLTVCTEGVEQMATLDFLREIKCDRIQGYLLGRPMAAALIPAALVRISEHNQPRAATA
jgi:EAL domain-containing protein (putative c-di-GMP-specific phosphodiesterase class I)